MIVGTTAGEVLVTKLEESQSGLVTYTISKKKSNSNNKRKHRVEFLYVHHTTSIPLTTTNLDL